MIDIIILAMKWFMLLFLGVQAVFFVGLVVWTIWADAIKPRLVPLAEIDRLADEIIENFPEPDEEAFVRHERAWYRSNRAEQTYWLRVRKAVRRRLSAAR